MRGFFILPLILHITPLFAPISHDNKIDNISILEDV